MPSSPQQLWHGHKQRRHRSGIAGGAAGTADLGLRSGLTSRLDVATQIAQQLVATRVAKVQRLLSGLHRFSAPMRALALRAFLLRLCQALRRWCRDDHRGQHGQHDSDIVARSIATRHALRTRYVIVPRFGPWR